MAFELSSHNAKWKACFHGAMLAHHAYTSVRALSLNFTDHVNPGLRDLMDFSPRFLTGWNLAFQIVFLIMSLARDISEIRQPEKSCQPSCMPALRHWIDFLFSALVFPYTMFVTMKFWSIYTLDRELVYPRAYDDVLSWTLNLSLHGWIIIVPAVELAVEKRHRGERSKELFALWMVQVAYAIVYYTTYYQTGRWLYPIFGIMNTPCVILYQIVIWLSIHSFYEIRWYFLSYQKQSCYNTVRKNSSGCINRYRIEEISKYGW